MALTQYQEAFITGLIALGNISDAAESARVNMKTARKYLNDPEVQEQLDEEYEAIRTAVRGVLLCRLQQLDDETYRIAMDKALNANTRLQAVRLLYERVDLVWGEREFELLRSLERRMEEVNGHRDQ